MDTNTELRIAEVRFPKEESELHVWFYPKQQPVKLTIVQIEQEIQILRSLQKQLLRNADKIGFVPSIRSLSHNVLRWLKHKCLIVRTFL